MGKADSSFSHLENAWFQPFCAYGVKTWFQNLLCFRMYRYNQRQRDGEESPGGLRCGHGQIHHQGGAVQLELF
jgi:hypothetical protein